MIFVLRSACTAFGITESSKSLTLSRKGAKFLIICEPLASNNNIFATSRLSVRRI